MNGKKGREQNTSFGRSILDAKLDLVGTVIVGCPAFGRLEGRSRNGRLVRLVVV